MNDYEDFDFINYYSKNETNLYPISESQMESENNKSEISKNNFNPTTFIQNELDINTKKKDINSDEFNKNNCQNKENNNIINNLYEELYINDRHYYIQNNINKIKENECSNTITLNNGKTIKSFNKMLINVINDLFKINEIDYEKLKDMQLLKNKRKRRTKKEIQEEEKTLKTEEKIIITKKKGRKQKELKILEENNIDDTHSKKADDNIIKKINTNFLNNFIKWINSSFLDEEGNNFLPEKNKFLKIKPIFANLKKQKVTELMGTQFKNILINDISEKYKNTEGNSNKKLVEKIYSEKKEYFIKFILELTFIDAFHIYNGETSFDDFKILFLKEKNIEEKKIEEFYNKFNKVDLFIKKIYHEEDRKSVV